MKKIVLLLTICLTASCVYKNMYHFEDGDLEWINPYIIGDTIKLYTSNGVDLLCMSKQKVYDKKSHFIANEGEEIFGDYNAVGYYEGVLIHNSTKHKIWLSVIKNSHNGIYINFQLGKRFCFDIEKDARNLNEQGYSVKDTVIIDDSNSEYGANGPLDDDFEYFKWSKKEGLIEYRLRDGTVYPKP